MTDFTIHSQATAPAASQPMLENLQKSIGFVPALYGVLAEAPKALEAYEVLATLFKGTSLSTTEQHVVWLTINYENNCDYCVPAHTGLAKMDKVPEDVIESLRNGVPLADSRLEVLRSFTRQLVQNRGWVADDEVELFLGAGYTRQNILEVVVGMAHKVISNYTNHLARTPVDSAFEKFAWVKPTTEVAA